MSKEHTVKALPHIYNQAFKKLPVPLIILNNEMVIIDINEAATQLTGIDENFCDCSLLNVFVVDDVTTPTELSIVLNKPEPFEASLLKAQNTDSPYTNGTKVSGSVSITDQGSVQKVHYLFSKVSFWEDGYLIRMDKKFSPDDYLNAFINLVDSNTNSLFQAIVNTSLYPFCIFDMDNVKFIIRNKAHLELDKKIVPNRDFLNMPLLVDSTLPFTVFKETMESARTPFIEKHEYLSLDGQKLHFEIHGYPVFTSDKRHFVVLNYRDITEEIVAEKSIQELTNNLHDLLTNLPGMLFRCLNELNWTMEYVSDGCKNLTGYSPEDLVNNTRVKYGDLIHPEDRKMVWDVVQEALRKKKYYDIKYRIIHKRNYIKWVAERGRGSYDVNGQVIAIEGFITDISEGKIAEINLKKELQISEAIAHISMELLKDTVTPIKVSRLVQDYVKEFTGSRISLIYSPDENGKSYTLFNHTATDEPISVKRDDFTLNQLELLQYLTQKSNATISNEASVIFLPGFDEHTVELSNYLCVPAFINNKLSGLLILGNSAEGYSEGTAAIAQRFINMFALGLYRLKAEETLQDAKKKAEESDRLKSLFLSNMSHEIRTPMNAIVGFAEMLQDTDLNREQKNKFLEVIIKSGDNLLRLINDIIDISRIEAGQLKLEYSDCLVNEMITDLETYFRQELIRQKKSNLNIHISLGHPESDFTLNTDCIRLKQVLNNLIGNAIKFTDEGFIEFGYHIMTGQIEFFVRDSGIGIATDMQKLIFERFGQVREAISRNQTGTGLGLTISKNLVEMLGGKIWVDSLPGEGSTFYFTLPLRFGYQHAEQPIKDTESDPQHSFSLKDKTILIVEDVDTNFFYLSSLLSKYNGKIIRANNGRKAIELVKSDPGINLVLMDIELPILDGYKATKEIRQIRPELPVIAQTAFAMMGERERSKEAGCVDYIAKPIRKEELISILKKYL